MSQTEPGLHSPIYIGTTDDDHIIIFWKSAPDTLSVHRPNGYPAKNGSFDIAKWAEQRLSYQSRDDKFDQYNDLVNCAWHFIGQRMIFINRATCSASTMRSGIHFGRIWRGIFKPETLTSFDLISPKKAYGEAYTQSAVAAASLFDYLTEIFRHVEPSPGNYAAYGHKSRELLILACTEIESAWRAVLDENTSNKKDRYTTADYFRVAEPLKLADWAVHLNDYPAVATLSPFKDWDGSRPTQSLIWYDAYNAVKHHREGEFNRATLLNLLNAMAALYIMQVAQWGPKTYQQFFGERPSPFSLVSMPTYSLEELYIPNIDGSGKVERALYFDTRKAPSPAATRP